MKVTMNYDSRLVLLPLLVTQLFFGLPLAPNFAPVIAEVRAAGPAAPAELPPPASKAAPSSGAATSAAAAAAAFVPPTEPVNPLVGKAAANFAAGVLLEGKHKPGTIALNKLIQKKKVILLDFWATWCRPCRLATPLVSKVAQDYKRKGVIFYAVNEQEDESKIRTFLDKNAMSMNVILDRDGAIGKNYNVNAIPTTVIIDGKGIIKAIHTGYSPTIAQDLSKELDQLLNTKKQAKASTSSKK